MTRGDRARAAILVFLAIALVLSCAVLGGSLVSGGGYGLYLPLVAKPAASYPPLEWDSRLDELRVTLARATCFDGCWRIVSVQWQDEAESGGRHHIDVDMRRDGERALGEVARVWWPDGQALLVQEDKPEPEYGANFAMYAPVSRCPYHLEPMEAGDKLHCLGLGTPAEPWRTIHTVFRVVYEWVE